MRNSDPALQAYRRRRVDELTAAGKSPAFIARELGITERSVSRHKRRLQISGPAAVPLTPEEHAKIRALLEDGCPYSEIARTLGRNVGTIQRHYPNQSKWEPIGLYHMKMAVRLGLDLVNE